MKVFVALLALAALAASAPTVDDKISKTLARDGSVTVIVTMANSKHVQLRDQFVRTKSQYISREAKLTNFYKLMKGHADEVQATVLSLLETAKANNPELRVDQIWTSNEIVLRNANAATIELIRDRADIAKVRQERLFPLDAPIDLKVYNSAAELPTAGEQWGVLNIEAEKVHATGNTGQGAVLANIDTGVRVTHEALRDGYRAEYGWYDPYQKTAEPNDQNGHGTHTMGTIAGRANGVGVAPGAQWIACKGCDTSSCSEAALLGCAAWIACPTLPDGSSPNCGMAPHVSSNSWGGGQEDDWYDDGMAAWRANDIVPLFSQGNSGPSCKSANSPGDSSLAIGVGSTMSTNDVSSFSSVGPTRVNGYTKPNVGAPGSDVVSAYYLSDTAYATLSGTSMACPHVAGLSGLLVTANSNVTVDGVYQALIRGAVPHKPTGSNCGDVLETTFPNNHVGYGIINAVNSVAIAKTL